MSELAVGSFLAESIDLIKGKSIETFSTELFVSIASSTVLITFLALTSNVSVSSRARRNALVFEEGSSGTLTNSVFREGTCGAGSDTGSSDQVESCYARGTGRGRTGAGIAGV